MTLNRYQRAHMFNPASSINRWLNKNRTLRYIENNNLTCEDPGLPSFKGVWPRFTNNGSVVIGAWCCFNSFRLRTHITVERHGLLEIGHHSFINDGANIYAKKSISIGHNARIGDMVYIIDSNFHQVSPQSPTKVAPVALGNNVWIGAGSIILPGSVIGDHSVIGAGSVVCGHIPAKTLAAGSPAHIIKTFHADDDWIRK